MHDMLAELGIEIGAIHAANLGCAVASSFSKTFEGLFRGEQLMAGAPLVQECCFDRMPPIKPKPAAGRRAICRRLKCAGGASLADIGAVGGAGFRCRLTAFFLLGAVVSGLA